MSVFLAPSSIGHGSRQAGQIRAFLALDVIRQVFLLLAFLGALGILSQFFVLGILCQTPVSLTITKFCGRFLNQAFFPVWLGMCVVGLTICIASSTIASRLATKGGKALLEAMRDDPCERSLLSLLQQISDGTVLLRPTFRLGSESYVFDLVIISSHGLTFVRSRPGLTDHADVAPVQAACSRLGEQYSLPLLKRVRFIQLWAPKVGPDWQTSQLRDLGRFFPRSEISTTRQEIAHSLRAIYNLALPASQKAIPVQGTLPTSTQIRADDDNGLRQKRKGFRAFGKLILYACLVLFLGGLGVFLLQIFDYAMAEKILVPARAVLRNVLPANWQERLGLGEETLVDEKHVYAEVSAPSIMLSLAVGQAGQGNPIKSETELLVLQAREEKGRQWFLVSLPGGTGWLPDSAMRARHLIPEGSALYARPDINAKPQSLTDLDRPVALVSVWKRPTAAGEVVWSKVLFLNRNTAYFRGGI